MAITFTLTQTYLMQSLNELSESGKREDVQLYFAYGKVYGDLIYAYREYLAGRRPIGSIRKNEYKAVVDFLTKVVEDRKAAAF